MPISFRDGNQPLGTHVFTAMSYDPSTTKIQWIAISLDGDDSASTLNRLEIPAEVHKDFRASYARILAHRR